MMFVSDPGDGKQSFRKMNETLTISQAWSLWINFRRTARNVFFLSIVTIRFLFRNFNINLQNNDSNIWRPYIKSIINIGK